MQPEAQKTFRSLKRRFLLLLADAECGDWEAVNGQDCLARPDLELIQHLTSDEKEDLYHLMVEIELAYVREKMKLPKGLSQTLHTRLHYVKELLS